MVTVNVANDAVAEAMETLNVSISGASAGTITAATASGSILNDDTLLGTAGADAMTVGEAAGQSVLIDAGDGNDTIALGSLAYRHTTVDGGVGDDIFTVTNTNPLGVNGIGSQFMGNTGIDTISYSGATAINIDLRGLPTGMVTGMEVINLTGAANNILSLNLRDVLDITDNTGHVLRIQGNAGDVVNFGHVGATANVLTAGATILDEAGLAKTLLASSAGDANALDVSIAGRTYDVYQYGSGLTQSTVLIDTTTTHTVL